MAVQFIDVPKEASPGRSWLGNRAAPTQSHPRQTLFGTTLQRRDKQLVDELRSINLNNQPEDKPRAQQTRTRSPQLEAVFGAGEEMLLHNKEELVERQKQRSRAEHLLSAIEEKSRYFQVQPQGDIKKVPRERSKASQKYSDKDLEHAPVMNDVGLKKGSYNHHKYGNQPPVHQYCLVGDPLRKGMDFTEVAEKPNHLVPKMPPFKRHKDPYAPPKEAYMKDRYPAGKTVTIDDVALPPNIQHLFGTQVCEMLLADPEQVKKTIENQKRSQIEAHRPHKPMERVVMPDEGLHLSYQEMGTSTRSNIFGPGVTCNHKVGSMKQNFNEDPHRRRVAETDEYRYQRDELSLWWQHETIRGALKKDWDAYAVTLPKFSVNWDRSAKRPPPPPKPKEPKPKPRPRPKKAPTPPPVNDMVFEDIEFKTPPLTPPAVPPPAPPPANKIDDDDFWDFYNQGVPLP